MTLATTPELTMMRDTLRRFVTEEVIPLQQQHALDPQRVPPKDLRRQVRMRSKGLGLYAIDMPADVGGGGVSFSDRCQLEMDLYSHDTVFFDDVLGGPGGPHSILLALGADQRQRYLAPLMSGEMAACFALSEADAGSDATALRARAEHDGDAYVLNGMKSIITNAPQADFALVFAVTGEASAPGGGISCLIVDADTPGYRVSREHTCMGFTGFQGELAFDNVSIPAANVVGQEGLGLLLALDWINGNRVRTAAMATGIARRLLSRSASYAKQRVQFGTPIASQQAVQLKIADMATELHAAECMVAHAAQLRDEGIDIRKVAAMTKLYCSEMVNRAGYEAIQIHGGAGCLAESGIERAYRMVRVLTILEGTSEMQRLTVARRVLKEVA
jgi:alkylation response protein AidB-like acyl-CoA dehydrogenase